MLVAVHHVDSLRQSSVQMKFIRIASIAAICALVPLTVSGQTIRSPEMNLEFHRAKAALKSGGSLLEAKTRLDRVLDAAPTDTDAYVLRSRVQLALRRHPDALSDARRAAELDSVSGEVQFVLCQAARAAGDTTLALQALQKASSTIEADPLKHIVLSREAMLLGHFDTSESLARVAVALDGTNPEAHYQLARALALDGKKDAAVLILSRGIDEGRLSADYVAQDPVFDSTGIGAMVISGN